MRLIFDEKLLNNRINMPQANYIIDKTNWQNSLENFKTGFKKITNENNNNSITYIKLEDNLCYTGFIRKNIQFRT